MKLSYLPLPLAVGAAWALAFTPQASAQQLADMILINDIPVMSGNPEEDQLFRLTDLDGNGSYQDAGETKIVFDSPVPAWIRDARFRKEGAVPVMYWNNNKPFERWIVRGADVNGDGRLEGSEVQVFFPFDSLTGGANPGQVFGVALGPDGSVYGATTFPGGYVVRLRDLNGDGVASGAGEVDVWVNNVTSNFSTIGVNGQPVPVGIQNFQRMTPYGNDGLLIYSTGFGGSKDECVYRMRDLNGNGSVADAGEINVFFNGTGAIPNLPKNPDFGSGGPLPSLRVSVANDTYARFNHLATGIENGVEVYYFACDSSNTSQFAFNEDGLGMNGLILRAVDLNLNGNVNDSGEVTVFYDGSSTSGKPTFQQLYKILGIDWVDGALYVSYLNEGGSVAAARLADTTGNGVADVVETGLWDSSVYGVNDPFTLGTPFVAGSAAAPFGAFTPYKVTGQGCAQYGASPIAAGVGFAKIGTADFVAQLRNAPIGALGRLYIGASTQSWLGVPLPFDLGLLGYPGCTLYQDLAIGINTITQAVGPNPATDGQSSLPLLIPNNPVFIGVDLPMQWLVAVPFPTLQIGLTPLLEVTIGS